MLYTQNLEELIFHRHEMHDTDELVVVSGYIGPGPVARLKELPFNSTVIYGMYGESGIGPSLHNAITALQKDTENLSVFYSKLPVHSKCYVWKKANKVVHGLIGSANFSTNGLKTPFREVLAETTFDTFAPLDQYLAEVLNNSISCLEIETKDVTEELVVGDICKLLLVGRNGEVQERAGLNWGQSPKSHVKPNDAYIKITVANIKHFPELFPPKTEFPLEADERGRANRNNDAIEMIWDDGTTMEGLLEGSQPIGGKKYPKQISSFPRKSELGEYFRKRLGVPLGQPVRRHHLDAYGRTDVEITLVGEGVYKMDFSQNNSD